MASTFTCNGPHHVGDRELPVDQKGHGNLCKACKTLKNRTHKAEKAKEKKESKHGRFESGAAWLEAATAQRDGGGRFFYPKREEFTTEEAYNEALELLNEHKQAAKRKYMDTDNKKKRAAYAEAKTTEEGRELLQRRNEVNDRNKMARKQRALDEGLEWCAFGSHKVSTEDMIFDAVEDLGLDLCIPGRRRHHACIKHFHAYHLAHDSQTKRAKNPRRIRLEESRASAKQRGIEWTLSQEKIDAVFDAPCCHYCAREFGDATPGFDRVDPWGAYDDGNVVAACSECNMSKGGLTEQEFRQVCKNVVSYTTTNQRTTTFVPYRRIVRRPAADALNAGATTASTWRADTRTSFTFQGEEWLSRDVLHEDTQGYPQARYNANRRGLEFTIEKDDYRQLARQPCTYCGVWEPNAIGMDRVDSERGYHLDNVVPCCPTCNYLKRGLTTEGFKTLAAAVARAGEPSGA